MNSKIMTYAFVRGFFALLLAFTVVPIFGGDTTTVNVQNFSFSPSNITVTVGDVVKFQWVSGTHTTTCDGIFAGTSLPPGAATWDQPINSTSTTFFYTVTVAGTYIYKCIFHAPGMGGTITAEAKFITVTSPNGSELWTAGETREITWTDNIQENVKIFLFKGGVKTLTISRGSVSDGSFLWTIPSTLITGSNYRVKIQSSLLGSIKDQSNSNFTISAGPFNLAQNYPNPFNPVTAINFQIPEAGLVTLIIYDLNGREITTLVDEYKDKGSYDVTFNASDLASGIYFYRLKMNNLDLVRKMTIIK